MTDEMRQRLLVDLYRAVFNLAPAVRVCVQADGYGTAFVIDGWLRVEVWPAGGWLVRVYLAHLGSFRHLPCMRRFALEPEWYGHFWQASMAAVRHEAHLRAHAQLGLLMLEYGHDGGGATCLAEGTPGGPSDN